MSEEKFIEGYIFLRSYGYAPKEALAIVREIERTLIEINTLEGR
jgi:hypothetical protein